jgi:hypothetical protein
MVAAANPKRQNENESSKDSDNIEVSVEPFNPATSMKKRKTGNANLVKSAFEDTLNNFAEDDEQNSTCEWHYCIRSFCNVQHQLIHVNFSLQWRIRKEHGHEVQHRSLTLPQTN